MMNISHCQTQFVRKFDDGVVLEGKFDKHQFVEGIAFIPGENGHYVFKGKYSSHCFYGEKKSPNGDYSYGFFRCTQLSEPSGIRDYLQNLVLDGQSSARFVDGILFQGTFIADKFVAGTITDPEKDTFFSGAMTNFGFFGSKYVINTEFSIGSFRPKNPFFLSANSDVNHLIKNLVLDGDNCYQHIFNKAICCGKFMNGICINSK